MFANPTAPWGRGWDGVNFKIQIFFLGLMKCSDLHRKVNFCQPVPHEGLVRGEGVKFKQNVLLEIKCNIQICTEKSCLPSPNPHGVERSLHKNCYKLHDLVQKSNVL